MTEDLDALSRQMRENLARLEASGLNAYPYAFDFTHTVDQVVAAYADEEDEDVLSSVGELRLPGRLMSVRAHGKTMFADLRANGQRLQLYVRRDVVGDDAFALFKVLDLGDILGSTGELFRTRTGELTLKVTRYEVLAKCLRPLPEKWHGLVDQEIRYRQRYLDLVVNPEVRDVFIKRSQIVSAIRRFLDGRGYLEVETPVLQPIYGGGFARPFMTHHNALNMPLYLRIADELYLKRLIAGGFDRVYEIGKDFRNEGIDRSHNPEFTMLELYEAYTDYNGMMQLYEDMVTTVAQEVFGTLKLAFGEHEIDLSPPWPRRRFFDALNEETGVQWQDLSVDEVRRRLPKMGLEPDKYHSLGKMYDGLFSKYVEPDLIQPCFIVDYPLELSPLAKVHRADSRLVERFEPYIAGMEVGNAFSELNDPADQRRRFDEQTRLREEGEDETQPLDEDYLRALEMGMPPTGGLGVGIDRLVMLLTGQTSIRDVLLFPHMRPEGGLESR